VITTDDVVDLLSVATGYDNRNASTATVLAWTTAGQHARWTREEALAAIHAHYAESTEFLMPAHVTARIRADRQDRALRAEQAALEAAPANPAAAERIQRIIDELAERMGWSEDGQERSGFALRVRCPHCHAAPGDRCVAPTTGKPLRRAACHPSRADLLAEHLRGAS
jgi:hypothetical protein